MPYRHCDGRHSIAVRRRDSNPGENGRAGDVSEHDLTRVLAGMGDGLNWHGRAMVTSIGKDGSDYRSHWRRGFSIPRSIVGIALGCTLIAAGPRISADGLVERFTDGDAERGAPLYKRYCRGCHGVDGRGGAHTFMPHVGNLTRKGYIERIPDSFLYVVIAEGGEAVGKSGYMPAWQKKLSEQDIKDVIAHIRSLPTY